MVCSDRRLASFTYIVITLAFGLAAAFNDDLCAQYGELVPMPGIDGADFCQTAKLTAGNMEKCLLLDMAGQAFTGRQDLGVSLGNSVGALACKAAQQVPIATNSIDGNPISHNIADRRPLPVNFASSVLDTEGSTYHFWWTQLYNFGTAASCAATLTPLTQTQGSLNLKGTNHWNKGTGWEVQSVVWSNANLGTNEAGVYLPLAAIMVKGDTMAVIVRGTETFSDWEADFTYSQVAFAGPVSWPGRTHEGFSKLAAYLWLTGVQEAVDALVLREGGGIKHVVVTGHSMGAGVSTLLSYTIQAHLQRAKSVVRVDGLLFAPPNVGDQVFAEAYGAMVNGRRIPFKSDIVSQLPCAPTVTACVRGPWVGAPMIATGVWAYQTIPGTVMLTPEGMPTEVEAWSDFRAMYACQLGRYVVATHVCAYQCYLSQFVQGGVSSNMCRLRAHDPQTAGGTAGDHPAGSYCFSFPVASGAQYPYANSPVEALANKVASMFV